MQLSHLAGRIPCERLTGELGAGPLVVGVDAVVVIVRLHPRGHFEVERVADVIEAVAKP